MDARRPAVLAALWFSMTRPNVFPVLLAWAVALLVVGLLKRQILLWGAVAGALVLVSVYSYVYNVRSDDTWRAGSGVTRTTIAYAYPIGCTTPWPRTCWPTSGSPTLRAA